MAKQLDIRDTIHFPRDLVFDVYREKLAELHEYLPNIDSITVERRTVRGDGSIELVNRWRASQSEVPSVLRPFVKPEMLQWYDYAIWDCEAFVCHWRTEMAFLDGAISSTGTNYYKVIDASTMEIHLTGTIEVEGAKLPCVPRFMAGKAASAVEGAVLKMTEPNLRAINRGFEQYISEHYVAAERAVAS